MTDNPLSVKSPFRSLTLDVRNVEPPAVYTPKELARMCVLSRVPLILAEAHQHGSLHMEQTAATAAADFVAIQASGDATTCAVSDEFPPTVLTPPGSDCSHCGTPT